MPLVENQLRGRSSALPPPQAAADGADSERCEQMTNFASHCFVDYAGLLLFRFKLFRDDCRIYVNSAGAEHRGLGG